MRLNKPIHCLLFALATLSFSLPGHAGMLGTAQIQAGSAKIEMGDSAQQRDWLQQQLVNGGVGETDATMRVAAMTNSEIARIHQRIDEMPAGGSDGLVIALVIFAVLEITGYIDVIPDR